GSKYKRPATDQVSHSSAQGDADETQVLQLRENLNPFYQPEWVSLPQDQFLTTASEITGRQKRKDGKNKKQPQRPNYNQYYSVQSNRKPYGIHLPPFNLEIPMNLNKPLFSSDMQQRNQHAVLGFQFTTALPLQYEASTKLYPVYPTISSLSSHYQEYNGPRQILDSHTLPLIGTIEQPKVEYLSQSASNVYELTESPSDLQKVYISVADDIKDNETDNEKVATTTVSTTTTTTNKPQPFRVHNRGKFRRDQSRF
ncbi:unnamed protein product, partial [Acanthoscelides obtectus]